MDNFNNNQPSQTPQFQPAPQNTGKGLSVAGLVLGIISAVFGWFGVIGIVALVCGIVGIVCAVSGKKKAQAAGVASGLATAGLVLSIIGTCFAGIGVLACFACASCVASAGGAATLF